uniref:DOD-type homing endonuclease domain-containing protein n=1 Tax=Chromera velia CCMP2878 TaxID=1169474 RepID=A0A0G4FLC4_9ALVE|eukprot:Cvel_17621.t1-p1 / transcript=Cvel_17621.t1 / gene=Cvel_17621 / organism=Chromera_velia_CCMP2878 / gene_product=hypothetical protein / transcript_product=hypothetical protein / location=Cvel_scaffold1418:5898-7793(+) / protein_length=292 / sequence_SO=supercontig / SO=protein_coding / is_pseudo=false
MVKYADYQWLERLKRALESTHPVSLGTKSPRGNSFHQADLNVVCTQLWKTMCELLRKESCAPGFSPSHKCKYVRLPALDLPVDQHYNALLRGVFEGDGSLVAHKRHATMSLEFASSNRGFVSDVRDVINKHALSGVQKELYGSLIDYKLPDGKSFHSLRFYDREVLMDICDWLYPAEMHECSTLMMPRKFKRVRFFQDVFSACSKPNSAIPNAERRQDFVSRLSGEGPGELGISLRELVSQFDPENPVDLQAVGVKRAVGRAARDALLRQFAAPPPHSCSCCSLPFSSHYPS